MSLTLTIWIAIIAVAISVVSLVTTIILWRRQVNLQARMVEMEEERHQDRNRARLVLCQRCFEGLNRAFLSPGGWSRRGKEA